VPGQVPDVGAPSSHIRGVQGFLEELGPGLITGAADVLHRNWHLDSSRTRLRLFRDQCGENAVLVGYSERSVSSALGGHRRSPHKRQESDGSLC
jgi:hypothetical protein